MSESKIDAWQRKIRNARRRQEEREKERMWNKLKEDDKGGRKKDIDIEIVRKAVKAKTRRLRAGFTVETQEIVLLNDANK